MEEAGYNIIPESELEYSELIGSRESRKSTVYKARWTHEGAERMVAAKSCNNFREEEVQILAELRHKNVIKFLGLVKLRSPPDSFFIVTELADKGSLWCVIAQNRENWQEYRHPVWLKWAEEGAEGLRYIHQKNYQHGDVKSPNFVITADNTLKICDLGTARKYSYTVSTNTVRGSCPWMAPEAMGVTERQEASLDGKTRKACKVTAKADVFSYAVVLWELITGKVPHEEKGGLFEIYKAVVDKKERLEIPTECPDSLADLMAKCWDADHRQRPDMKEVHQFLVEFDATDATTLTSLSKTTAASHYSAPANISKRTQIAPAIVSMKKRKILGMLEYRQEDDVKIIKTIITDFHPWNAKSHLPGLPAYIIFMCIRHANDINDDRKVKALLTGVINGIKKTVKNHLEDFEYVSFWLTNTIRLMHTFKQYSGEETFSSQNTHRQNEHCLRNFDLSEYRQVMNDLGVHIYQMLVHIIENKLQPMIVPAMLEADVYGQSTLHGSQYITMESLIYQLTMFLIVMNNHGMDPEVIKQAIKQSCYFVTASTINSILLRKDMYHWFNGFQIRYNMSVLEEWLRSIKLYDHSMEEIMEPLVQIAELLKVSKRTEDDVRLICETCTKLTTTQVVRILNIHIPDWFQQKPEVSFIRKVQDKLAGRMDTKKDAQLLIDTEYMFPVTFPFNPSSVLLNEITIPDTFKLDCVKRV